MSLVVRVHERMTWMLRDGRGRITEAWCAWRYTRKVFNDSGSQKGHPVHSFRNREVYRTSLFCILARSPPAYRKDSWRKSYPTHALVRQNPWPSLKDVRSSRLATPQ